MCGLLDGCGTAGDGGGLVQGRSPVREAALHPGLPRGSGQDNSATRGVEAPGKSAKKRKREQKEFERPAG